jgi:hypothetical protein
MIQPRPITVTANAQSRVFGIPNPALTYAIGGLGLVGGDILSGSLATTATTNSAAGTYPITQGTLANMNYAITYVGANLTVTPASTQPVSGPSPLVVNLSAQLLNQTAQFAASNKEIAPRISWLESRNQIAIQYVVDNAEVKNEVAALAIKLNALFTAGPAGEFVADFMLKLKDAWDINTQFRKGDRIGAAKDFFTKIVLELFVDAFGGGY